MKSSSLTLSASSYPVLPASPPGNSSADRNNFILVYSGQTGVNKGCGKFSATTIHPLGGSLSVTFKSNYDVVGASLVTFTSKAKNINKLKWNEATVILNIS